METEPRNYGLIALGVSLSNSVNNTLVAPCLLSFTDKTFTNEIAKSALFSPAILKPLRIGPTEAQTKLVNT